MKVVTDIQKATHWQAAEDCPALGITKNRIYRFFKMFDTLVRDTEYWLCDDNGNATMAYITENGKFLRDAKTIVPFLTEKEFFGLNIEHKKALMHTGY